MQIAPPAPETSQADLLATAGTELDIRLLHYFGDATRVAANEEIGAFYDRLTGPNCPPLLANVAQLAAAALLDSRHADHSVRAVAAECLTGLQGLAAKLREVGPDADTEPLEARAMSFAAAISQVGDVINKRTVQANAETSTAPEADDSDCSDLCSRAADMVAARIEFYASGNRDHVNSELDDVYDRLSGPNPSPMVAALSQLFLACDLDLGMGGDDIASVASSLHVELQTLINQAKAGQVQAVEARAHQIADSIATITMALERNHVAATAAERRAAFAI